MIPLSLQQLINESLDGVYVHHLHALLPIHRQAIYDCLGPARDSQARRIRGWLDIVTARRVLPIWLADRPHDGRVMRLLTLAERVLRNQGDERGVRDEAEVVWWWLTDDDHGGRYEKLSSPAYYSLGAAILAVFSSLDDNPLIGMHLEGSETDANIDEASSDAAKWAANAAAGPVWRQDSNNAERLKFWEWWLTEAVPAAWEQER